MTSQELDAQDNLQEPVQQKLPLAFLHGKAVVDKPEDLYIPPDALEIILETFEGPLDLLLYLIKKHKLDVLELSIFSITEQYVSYVEMMSEFQLELAGEYLVMAALLHKLNHDYYYQNMKSLKRKKTHELSLSDVYRNTNNLKTLPKTLTKFLAKAAISL